MSEFLYFAYGSNMLTARLAARCPSARVVGAAHAPGFGLAFAKRGMDLSGKATLVPQTAQSQPGVVFAIKNEERLFLDQAEGPGYHRHDDFKVMLAGSDDELTCSTYIARDILPGLVPFDWYVALIMAGALEHGLPAALIENLRQVRHCPDMETQRPGQRAALNALRQSGYISVASVLSH
ncbi:gamma-glutamylcyclotransferase family protein [Rhizobium sp. L1K21]|uniref:gamma-glutamylcyclotransferase family protein n=1 Tax=Rhizobium sp. L1K21 TaxID=2954933 RepID=UPI002092E1B3|nr:gamma-glutamylcyclotransferase family protein [Rhizobium sp. L1K21]MCO6184984.1 gamma-glutamylcyclotransferase [Rhizobium sp. L1K21]